MKKIFNLRKSILIAGIVALASSQNVRADEGMWIPSLIGKNYDEMVRLGLKLYQRRTCMTSTTAA